MAFLLHPVGQAVAVCVIFGALAWWHGERRYGEGVAANEAKWQAKLTADAEKARAKEEDNAAKGAKAGQAVAVKTAEIRVRTEYLIREVPTYVTIDPGRAHLSVGLVRLHDAAATGLSPTAYYPGRANDAASDFDDAQLAEAVIGNYGACRADQARLAGLQSLLKDLGLAH